MIARLWRALAAALRPTQPPLAPHRVDDGWPHTDTRIAAEMRTPWWS